MSDVPATPAPESIPAVEPVAPAAPAVEVPVSPSEAPPVETPVAPSSPVVPAVDGASDTPTEVPAEKPAEVPLHTDEPGLLAAEVKPIEAKPETPVVEAPPVAPEPVVYEPFTLPDGVTVEPERLNEFTAILGNQELAPQARAQQLIDMHLAEVARLQENTLAEQHRAFSETRREWRNQIMGDEQLGGAAFETNRAAAQRMLNMFVPEANREAFNSALLLTGASDNPEIFRFLVNLARKFDEPVPSPAPHGPPPDIARSPNSGRRLNYDNPTSPRANGAGH